jgi:hypothetical protein
MCSGPAPEGIAGQRAAVYALTIMSSPRNFATMQRGHNGYEPSH